MDFVSQAFSKNRVLQQKKMLFDYIHKYIHDTIEVINEEQNGNLNRLVLLPRQSSPVKTSPHHHTISWRLLKPVNLYVGSVVANPKEETPNHLTIGILFVTIFFQSVNFFYHN